jgi:PGF-CTERM protein
MIVLGLTAASAAVTAQDQFEPRDSREQADQINPDSQISSDATDESDRNTRQFQQGGDQWSDECNAETQQITPGTYSDTLSPDDVDVLIFENLSKGEYAAITLQYSTGQSDSFVIDPQSGEFGRTGSITDQNGSRAKNIDEYGGYVAIDPIIPILAGNENTAKFRFYREGSKPACLLLSTTSGGGSWSLTFEKNTPQPPALGSANTSKQQDSEQDTTNQSKPAQPSPETVEQQNRTINSLRKQLTEQNQTISDLREQLAQKNQTVAAQDKTIQNLQAQLNTTETTRNTTNEVQINVTVAPGDSQQSFVEGGNAVISAQGSNADLSKVDMQWGGDTYSLDSSGEAIIPLTSVGEQEMTFAYDDVVETVVLDVDAATQGSSSINSPNGSTSTTDDDGGIVSVDGPGFGPLAAIIAFLLTALSITRLQGRSE